MKNIFSILVLLITASAFAQKPPMSAQDRTRLERLIDREGNPRDWPVVGPMREYLTPGTNQLVYLPDPPVLPSRWRRNYDLDRSTIRHLNRMLERHTLGTGWSETRLRKIIPYLGIRMAPSFLALSPEVRVAALNQVVDVYTRLPWNLVRTLRDRNRGIDLVSGGVTNHPRANFVGTLRPRGWSGTRTVDSLAGGGAIGDLPTIIAGDRLNDRSEAHGHGSTDLVLHEVGHTVDRYFRDNLETFDYSVSRPFIALVEGMDYASFYAEHLLAYHRDYAEENFAELFTRYYLSTESRSTLEWKLPGVSEFFEQSFRGR